MEHQKILNSLNEGNDSKSMTGTLSMITQMQTIM